MKGLYTRQSIFHDYKFSEKEKFLKQKGKEASKLKFKCKSKFKYKMGELSLGASMIPTLSSISNLSKKVSNDSSKIKIKSTPILRESEVSSQSSKGIQVSESYTEIHLPQRIISSNKEINNKSSFLNIKGFTTYDFNLNNKNRNRNEYNNSNNDLKLYDKHSLKRPLKSLKNLKKFQNFKSDTFLKEIPIDQNQGYTLLKDHQNFINPNNPRSSYMRNRKVMFSSSLTNFKKGTSQNFFKIFEGRNDNTVTFSNKRKLVHLSTQQAKKNKDILKQIPVYNHSYMKTIQLLYQLRQK